MQVEIERIIFLGLPKKGSFKVKLPGGKVGRAPSGQSPLATACQASCPSCTCLTCHVLAHILSQTVPLEQGPLSQRAPQAVYAHVLRAPWLPVSSDWTLEVVKA